MTEENVAAEQEIVDELVQELLLVHPDLAEEAQGQQGEWVCLEFETLFRSWASILVSEGLLLVVL